MHLHNDLPSSPRCKELISESSLNPFCGGLFVAQISDDDLHTRFRETATGGSTKAPRSSGDNGDLAIEGRNAVVLFG